MGLIKWLQGKKTYLTVIAVVVCAGLSHYGVEIPEWIWPALGAAGLGFIRAAVTKVVK